MFHDRHKPDTLRGVLLLAALILSVVVAFYLLNRHDSAKSLRMVGREREALVRDSINEVIRLKEIEKAEHAAKRAEWKRKHEEYERKKAEREEQRMAEDTITVMMHRFDPNNADSSELVHLGLRPWMARSVCHYREAGGRFRKVQDVRKIYGMTDSLYAVLEPYVVIASDTTSADSVAKLYVSRRKCDTVLQLNLTDTAELQLIRGIGRYTAVEIIRYRERLGGYVSPEQIREIPRLRNIDSLLPHLRTDTVKIRPLYVNQRSAEWLARHPYLSFEQAKGLYMYRRRYGGLRSLDELGKIKDGKEPLFSESDLRRLAPYVRFEE